MGSKKASDKATQSVVTSNVTSGGITASQQNTLIDTSHLINTGYMQPLNTDWSYNWPFKQPEETMTKEEIYELQKAVFDSNISDEMKIKLISYLGKNLY